MIVYVYGSLRKGCHNHDRFMCRAKYLNTSTISYFQLYKLCSSYPTAVQTKCSTDKIVVEAYEVNDESLKELDRLEGHPNSGVLERIEILDDNGQVGFVYCCTPKEALYLNKNKIISSGDWCNQ